VSRLNHQNHQRALRVFAEHVVQHATLDDSALDELCRTHPELEARLRRMARERADVRVDVPHVASRDVDKLGGKTSRARGARSRYVLLGEAARGGMGVILRVWDSVLERPLAMKILDAGNAEKKSSTAEETRAAS
jgi:hypothetical protein